MASWLDDFTEELTTGQKIADRIAKMVGSWTFILIQSLILATWMAWNIFAPPEFRFDPAPFIGLNLFLSFEAAYTAPFIMISQRRSDERDRHHAEMDFQCNIEAERRIEELQIKIAEIEDQKLNRILELLGDKKPASMVDMLIELNKKDLGDLPNYAKGGWSRENLECIIEDLKAISENESEI